MNPKKELVYFDIFMIRATAPPPEELLPRTSHFDLPAWHKLVEES